MKISKIVNNLEEFMEKYGDVECWYVADEEYGSCKKMNCYPDIAFATIDDEIVSYDEIIKYEYKENEYESICLMN